MKVRAVAIAVQVASLLSCMICVSSAETRPWDLNTVAVRVLLGVEDTQPTKWDGRAKLTAGEILRIDPWRFRPGDAAVGRSGWKTSSHVLKTPVEVAAIDRDTLDRVYAGRK